MDEATNPEAEVETVEQEDIEGAAPETVEDDTPEGESDEAEEDSTDDDSEEVEYDGEKYRVPKALKDAFLRNADYTQKTQQLAEQRKAVETTLQNLTAVSEHERAAQTQIATIEAKIALYDGIDWDAWAQQDPMAVNNARWELNELRNEYGAAQQNLTAVQAHLQSVAQQETAKRLEEGEKVLRERIPGFNQDKLHSILDESQKAYPFSRDEIVEAVRDNPLVLLVLNDALEVRKQATKAATVAKVQKQQAIQPAATVRGKSPVIKGLDDRLSAEEWIKRRNAQVAKR